MSDKKQWGGIRQGSGRPPTLKNPVRVTIWLEADELDWIKSQGKQGEVTRQLINKERNLTMEERTVTAKEFSELMKRKDFQPSTLDDRVGQCITCGANREVTYWRLEGKLIKFIIVSCNH